MTKKGNKDFAKAYEEATKSNSGNLAPMLEILHGITEKDTTMQYLNQISTPTNYQELREKLLQHSGAYKAFLENPNASKQIQIPKMFQDRKLLTLDFVTDFSFEHQDVGQLSCVPVSSQESYIVQGTWPMSSLM